MCASRRTFVAPGPGREFVIVGDSPTAWGVIDSACGVAESVRYIPPSSVDAAGNDSEKSARPSSASMTGRVLADRAADSLRLSLNIAIALQPARVTGFTTGTNSTRAGKTSSRPQRVSTQNGGGFGKLKTPRVSKLALRAR